MLGCLDAWGPVVSRKTRDVAAEDADKAAVQAVSVSLCTYTRRAGVTVMLVL